MMGGRKPFLERFHEVASEGSFADWDADERGIVVSSTDWEYIVLPETELSRNFFSLLYLLSAHGTYDR